MILLLEHSFPFCNPYSKGIFHEVTEIHVNVLTWKEKKHCIPTLWCFSLKKKLPLNIYKSRNTIVLISWFSAFKVWAWIWTLETYLNALVSSFSCVKIPTVPCHTVSKCGHETLNNIFHSKAKHFVNSPECLKQNMHSPKLSVEMFKIFSSRFAVFILFLLGFSFHLWHTMSKVMCSAFPQPFFCSCHASICAAIKSDESCVAFWLNCTSWRFWMYAHTWFFLPPSCLNEGNFSDRALDFLA